MSTQVQVHISKFVIKSPTHSLNVDSVGVSKGFLKGIGEIWKVAPKSTAEDDDAMFCLFMLDWKHGTNIVKSSKIQTEDFDWRLVKIHEI